VDYILSSFRLTRPSLTTNHRLVSEPNFLYLVIAIQEAWLRIVKYS
jgi:hypothetical protein